MAFHPANLAQAVRSLRRTPAFSLTAIATIALGIGACTAIFSVVSSVLLRPLPYRDPARLVLITSDMTARNVPDFPLPPADYADLRTAGTHFEYLAAFTPAQQPLTGEDGTSDLIRVLGVTSDFFRLFGVQPLLGRDFVAEDATPAPAPPEGAPPPPPLTTASILSHEFWQRRFGGDPGVLGQVLRVGGGTTEIVGVLPPQFEVLMAPGLNVPPQQDLYTAMRIDFPAGSRTNVFLRAVGRLREGVSREQAQGQVDALVASLRQQFPIKETAGVRWRVEPLHGYLVASSRPVLLALMGAVTFVLLIACANVGNLLLVRGAAREREVAVRAALGGSRGAILGQLMTESVLLAGAGLVLGLLLATGGIRMLLALAPEGLPRLETIGLDLSVLGFATAAALSAAFLFGTVPALRATRVDLSDSLRAGTRSAGLGGGRLLRDGVVVAEVALAFVLLAGSGLMVRSFVALLRAHPGYDPQGVLTFFMPNLNRPEAEARATFVRELRDRLEALPGVTAVTAANPLPLDGGVANTRWGTEEAQSNPALFQQANLHIVLPGYFEALRTRILAGRVHTEAENHADHRLLVVDTRLAEKAFPGEAAVGKRILARVNTPEAEWFEIIGVVEHQRHDALGVPGREAMFLPDGFFLHGAAGRWAIRTTGNPADLAGPVREAVRQMDRGIAVTAIQPMAVFLDQARAPTRFVLTLIGVFAAIAVVLAAVGLYGVLATMVRQRTAEIGVRMAFGAQRGTILRLVVGHGLRLSAIGLVLGILSALALTRVMTAMLVGVGATDAATFLVMGGLFLVVAVVACWLPARQAASLDPTEALRAT